MSHAYDPADVRGPFHGLIGATLRALERAIEMIPSFTFKRHSDVDDVMAVRAMAEGLRTSDPAQARELLAIAARHEAMLESQAESAKATTAHA